jgi:hypothetical protein
VTVSPESTSVALSPLQLAINAANNSPPFFEEPGLPSQLTVEVFKNLDGSLKDSSTFLLSLKAIDDDDDPI